MVIFLMTKRLDSGTVFWIPVDFGVNVIAEKKE